MDILISGCDNSFKEGFNGAGVYMASGLMPSSEFALPVYIGSAVDFRHRILYEHLRAVEINNPTNTNILLFNHMRSHGTENTVWFKLESCAPEETLIREQIYLDYYKPYADEGRGFNFAHFAQAPMKGKKHRADSKLKMSAVHKGKPKSAETRLRMSLALKGKVRSASHRANLSKALKGRNVPEETRKRMSLGSMGCNAKAFRLLSPEGTLHEGINLKAFAERHGLDNSNLAKVAKGRIPICKGWTKPRDCINV